MKTDSNKQSILLIDFDGRLPNQALRKISAYHKALGDMVYLNECSCTPDKVYVSVLFTWNRSKALGVQKVFPNSEVIYGGTGWDLSVKLPPEVEAMSPDFQLYSAQDVFDRLRGAGKRENKWKKAVELTSCHQGRTTWGCIRDCEFCIIRAKEGKLRQAYEIKELINSNARANILTLLDANFVADPYAIDKLTEIQQRGLRLNLTQGIDARVIAHRPNVGVELVKTMRYNFHYVAWDLMESENEVLTGINTLLDCGMPASRLSCFMLTGFNTSFEEDMYRVMKLKESKIAPYVMLYNHQGDQRDHAFARWVNGRFHKVVAWDEFRDWVRVRDVFRASPQITQRKEILYKGIKNLVPPKEICGCEQISLAM